jgi:hypothetical protein
MIIGMKDKMTTIPIRIAASNIVIATKILTMNSTAAGATVMMSVMNSETTTTEAPVHAEVPIITTHRTISTMISTSAAGQTTMIMNMQHIVTSVLTAADIMKTTIIAAIIRKVFMAMKGTTASTAIIFTEAETAMMILVAAMKAGTGIKAETAISVEGIAAMEEIRMDETVHPIITGIKKNKKRAVKISPLFLFYHGLS